MEADVRQPGPLEKWFERSPGNVVGVKGPTAVGTEDQPAILPETPCLQTFGVLGGSMGLERLDSVPCERDGTPLAVLKRGEDRAALGGWLGALDAQRSPA